MKIFSYDISESNKLVEQEQQHVKEARVAQENQWIGEEIKHQQHLHKGRAEYVGPKIKIGDSCEGGCSGGTGGGMNFMINVPGHGQMSRGAYQAMYQTEMRERFTDKIPSSWLYGDHERRR